MYEASIGFYLYDGGGGIILYQEDLSSIRVGYRQVAHLLGIGQLVVGLQLVVDFVVLFLEAAGVELRNIVISPRPHRRRQLLRRRLVLVEGGGVELGNVLDRFAAPGPLQLGALLLSL